MLSTLYNITFSIVKPLVRKEEQDNFYFNFIKALINSNLDWDFLRITYLFSYDACCGLLGSTVFDDLQLKGSIQSEPTYCAPLDQGFDAYYKEFLSKRVGRAYRRQTKRLNELGDFHCEFFRDREALEHFDDFVAIEDSGWKGKQGSSLAKAPAYHEFCKTLCGSYCDCRSLLMSFSSVNDKRIAATLCSLEGNVCHVLRTGYLEDYSTYSPSNVLLMETIRHLCEHYPNITLVNTHPYSYGYKQNYCHTEESCMTYQIVNKTLKASMYNQLYTLKNNIKTGVERIRGRTRQPAISH